MENIHSPFEKFPILNANVDAQISEEEEKTFEGFSLGNISCGNISSSSLNFKKVIEKLENNIPKLKEFELNKQCNVNLKKKNSKLLVQPLKKSIMSEPLCLFCHHPKGRDTELGKFYSFEEITVHYYCLLFSSALVQNGDDDEGIEGFLPKDIMKELKRGAKLKCRYCSKTGATIGCNQKKCKRTYHFTCGLDKYVQFDFTNNFSSMCATHRKFQKGQNIGQEVQCPICLELMIADPKTAIWPPCCQKMWFHKLCIQQVGIETGLHHFKCPLCNCKEKSFQLEMQRYGVFLPDRDASWELEPNAYEELSERPNRCFASKCKCSSGRKTDKENTRWELVICKLCGATSAHRHCANLPSKCSCSNAPRCGEFECSSCLKMLKDSAQRIKEETREQRALDRRKKCNVTKERNENEIFEYEDNSEIHRESPASPVPSKVSISPDQTLFNLPSNSQLVETTNDYNNDKLNTDEIVSFGENFSNIIIRDLEIKRIELPLKLKEMKDCAESLPLRLVRMKMDENDILDTINLLTRNHDVVSIKLKHIEKFIRRSFNFHQMQVMRKIFEYVFQFRQSLLQCQTLESEPALNSLKITALRKSCHMYQMSLIKILVKSKTTDLLGSSDFLPEEKIEASNLSISQSITESHLLNNSFKESPLIKQKIIVPQSSKYTQIAHSELSENCSSCQGQLIPGYHQTTVKLTTGQLEIICSSCLTCNVIVECFPKFIIKNLNSNTNYIKSTSSPIEGDECSNFISRNSDSGSNCQIGDSQLINESIQRSISKQKLIYDYFGKSKPVRDDKSIIERRVLRTSTDQQKGIALSNSLTREVSNDFLSNERDISEVPSSKDTKIENHLKLIKLKLKDIKNIKEFDLGKISNPHRIERLPESNKRKINDLDIMVEDRDKKIKLDLDVNYTEKNCSVSKQNDCLKILSETNNKDTSTINNSSCIDSKLKNNTISSLRSVKLENNPFTEKNKEIGPVAHAPISLKDIKLDKKSCNMCNFAGKESGTYSSYATYECIRCEDRPKLCSLTHFDLWHTIRHNWMELQPTVADKHPKRNCKICKIDKKIENPTKFYCPACKNDDGYCSQKHFDKGHIDLKIQPLKVENSKLNNSSHQLEKIVENNTTELSSIASSSSSTIQKSLLELNHKSALRSVRHIRSTNENESMEKKISEIANIES